jgi:hypothetical protein
MTLYLYLFQIFIISFLHVSEFFRTFAENINKCIMTSRITLIKSYRNRETLRLMVQQEVADMIRSGEYEQQVLG